MSANLNIPAIENRDKQNNLVWHLLHAEREDICEALLREPVPSGETGPLLPGMAKGDADRTANWHRELLQARLRKVDDALDRLMSGSYGNCSKCGRWIEDTKLKFDPAIAMCISCWEREQRDQRSSLPSVQLETLAPFDTIWVRTLNSNYRVFLLDPSTGNALLEGGQFAEPVEAVLEGSSFGNSTFKVGWIGRGLRIQFCTNGVIVRTSPVQSIRVEHHASGEPTLASMSVVH